MRTKTKIFRSILSSWLFISFTSITLFGSYICFSKNQFSNTKQVEKINLNGEWEMYWSNLLNPTQINHTVYISNYTQIPGYWNKTNKHLPSHGYCTYRKVIPNNFGTDYLGIKIYKIHSAYNLWVNGVQLHSQGEVSKIANTSVPKTNMVLVPFACQNSEIEIVLQVSNYHHRNGGIAKQIVVGEYKSVFRSFIKDIAIDLIIFGFILVMAIYHFILFYYHKNKKAYLFFALFCFAMSFQIFFSSGDLISFIFPDLSWDIAYKFEYLLLYMSLPLFTEFAFRVFSKDYSYKIVRSIVATSALFVAFVLLTPTKVFSYSLPAFEIFAALSIIYVVYQAIRCLQLKRKHSIIFLSAFVIMGASAIIHIISNEFFYEQVEPIPIGVTLFILFQAFLLARQSSKAYIRLDYQAKELKRHRDHLNELVEERTAEIENQKEEIKKQAEHITDSINYAQYIQQAALPKKEYCDCILPNHFVFFKPKDTVSGDFYWIKRIKHYVVVVCADCTGHGVPGAFMSMLGISLLNEIVHKKEVTQANQILNILRSEIKNALHQESKETFVRDGMDMSVCVLNTKHNKLQYSGALSSLIIMREGFTKVIKGDRMPVGVFENENETFTNYEIDYESTDCFYMHTDGYVDQFNEISNRKFRQKNLIKLLSDVCDLTFPEQKQIIEQKFNNWKGNSEQIDDVLVVGFKPHFSVEQELISTVASATKVFA